MHHHHDHARSVTLPHGLAVKFGRTRTVAPRPQMRLANYLDVAALPAPPSARDYSPLAAASLKEMYLNDQLCDCVIACGAHMCGVMTGNAAGGSPFVATKDQVLAQYEAIGHYVPGDESTDQGCNEQDALDYWGHNGLPNGTKLLGNLNVKATDKNQVKLAMWLFQNLVFGIELPDAWIKNGPSASGFVWDVAGAPDPNNGHCVLGVGFDDTRGVLISTWGMTGWMTWAAVAKYAATQYGELHTALSPDQLARGQSKAPNGVDWASIVTDFNALGGKVPVPAPTPAPTPTASTLTLTQAQAALAAGWSKS